MTPVLMLVLAMAQEAPRCSISGHVYNAATGAPLARASVNLGGRAVPNRDTAPSTVTDEGGNFHFDTLTVGEYYASAERNGFLGDVATRPSCGASDVAIKLMPQGIIFGKVVDDLGEPVPGANVGVFHRAWLHGRRSLEPMQGTTSQADGTFALGSLRPGTYFFSAEGQAHPPPGQQFVRNYYPDTPDPQSAAPITVAAGTDVRGVELRVRTARMFTVRGRIVGDVAARAIMMMRPGGSAADFGFNTIDVKQGAFEFRGVAPGDYVLMAPFSDDANTKVAFVPITVADADIDDLRVTFAPAITVTGAIRLNDKPFTLPSQVRFLPVSIADMNMASAGQAENGSFAIKGLSPTRYRVMLELPNGYYIKAIRFAGQPLSTPEIDPSAGGTLEIILSDKPARVSGTVRDEKDAPVALAEVDLWSTNREIRSAVTSADGRFQFSNLPPGDYRAIAWEWIENGAIENPALRAAFASHATQFTLDEGTQQSADLKPIGKATVEAAIATLP